MDYTEAVLFIDNVIEQKNRKHSLEYMKNLMESFGSVEDKIKIIHVAGTNGKGSTCAMLSDVLEKAGYKVGMFTSPHLESYNERIRINGKEISNDDFAIYLSKIVNKDKGLSFFEYMTVVAFLYFYDNNVDIAVIETGLGGRLDITNIIKNPVLSIITQVGYDHMNILGKEIESIAYEKAGIIKKNCPVVLYLNSREVYNIVETTSKQRKAPFYYLGEYNASINNSTPGSAVFSVESKYFSYKEVKTGFFAGYQIYNGINFLFTCYVLNRLGYSLTETCILSTLRDVKWPGRMEIIHRHPLVILDGAHNIDGALAFSRDIEAVRDKKKIMVLGLLADKACESIAAEITRNIDIVIATKPRSKRGLDENLLASYIDESKEIYIEEDPVKAADMALDVAKSGDVICVTGSLYLIGQVREHLRRCLDD